MFEISVYLILKNIIKWILFSVYLLPLFEKGGGGSAFSLDFFPCCTFLCIKWFIIMVLQIYLFFTKFTINLILWELKYYIFFFTIKVADKQFIIITKISWNLFHFGFLICLGVFKIRFSFYKINYSRLGLYLCSYLGVQNYTDLFLNFVIFSLFSIILFWHLVTDNEKYICLRALIIFVNKCAWEKIVYMKQGKK